MGNISDRIKDFLWALKKNRQLQISIGVVAIILIAAGVGYAVFRSPSDDSNTIGDSADTTGTIEEESTIRRFTDGILVPEGKENYRPRAVMIENLVTIRPQSGLSEANIVYEALAEGGITRFLAIFSADRLPSEIGPVRSARHYFVRLAQEYEPVYFHAGGSPQANTLIDEVELVDVDAVTSGSPYYVRKDIDRAREHNLFTSADLINFAIRDLEVEDKGNFEPWQFKSDASIDDRPTTDHRLTIDFSSFSYEVEYVYDRSANHYLRMNGGEAHLDALTGKQLAVKNVIVQSVNTKNLGDGSNRLDMDFVGEGDATVFQDGQVIKGTWRKDNESSRTRFFNDQDEEVQLNAGPTWIEILPTDREVTIDGQSSAE